MPLWSHLKPLESVNTAQIIQCSLFVAPDVALCDTLTIHACTCDSLKGGGGVGGKVFIRLSVLYTARAHCSFFNVMSMVTLPLNGMPNH